MSGSTVRLLHTFVWFRWRTLVNTLRGSRRRDRFEELSRLLNLLVPVLLVLFLLPTAIVVGIGGFLSGRWIARNPVFTPEMNAVAVAVRLVLAALVLMIVLAPMIRAAITKATSQSRLLLMPVRRGLLHFLQVIAGTCDVWILVFLPFLFLVPVGLLSEGSVRAALVALVAGIGLTVVLGAMNSSLSFVMGLLFRKRRRGEWITLVLLLVLSLIGLVPLFFAQQPDKKEDEAGPLEISTLGEKFESILPAWTRAIPTEMYVRTVISSPTPQTKPIAWNLGGLLLWIGGLYSVSNLAFNRLIEQPEGSSARAGNTGRRFDPDRIPGFSSATTSVALAAVRSTLRTVRGKMSVFFHFLIVGVLFVGFRIQMDGDVSEAFLPYLGLLAALAGSGVALLGLQPILFNQFSIDRQGLTLQYLVPLDNRDLFNGKTLAGGILYAIAGGLCVLVSLVIWPRGHPLLWLALVPILFSGYVLLAPLGLLSSVLFPKTADLARMGKAGNPHALAALISFLATPLTMVPGVFLAMIGELLLGSAGWAAGLALGWSAIALVLYVPLTALALSLFERRRENLLLVANGR